MSDSMSDVLPTFWESDLKTYLHQLIPSKDIGMPYMGTRCIILTLTLESRKKHLFQVCTTCEPHL